MTYFVIKTNSTLKRHTAHTKRRKIKRKDEKAKRKRKQGKIPPQQEEQEETTGKRTVSQKSGLSPYASLDMREVILSKSTCSCNGEWNGEGKGRHTAEGAG